MPTESPAARIARHLRPGARVALSDGAGAPLGLGPALAEAARSVGGVSLLLGWCLALPVELDPAAFPDARSFTGGYALRAPIRDGRVRSLPVRLGSLPALLAGPLRPDVVVAGLRPGRRGLAFGTEVSWLPAAIDAGAAVLAEVNHALPAAAACGELSAERVVVVSEVERAPVEDPPQPPDPAIREIGRLAAALVPPGATIQYGPGGVGEAVLAALEAPVSVASGVITDGVVSLDDRSLLRGVPRAAYMVGTARVYRWGDGRPVLTRVEETHDVSRLGALPVFVSLNTAFEIDPTGQVNVERVGGDPAGSVGGHPDFALAASRSPGGLSVIALPTVRGGRRTLVERLSGPTTTSRADVDVVVTERGVADLRGLDDRERGAALRALWEGVDEPER